MGRVASELDNLSGITWGRLRGRDSDETRSLRVCARRPPCSGDPCMAAQSMRCDDAVQHSHLARHSSLISSMMAARYVDWRHSRKDRPLAGAMRSRRTGDGQIDRGLDPGAGLLPPGLFSRDNRWA